MIRPAALAGPFVALALAVSGCVPLATTAATSPAGQAAVGRAVDAALARAGLRPALPAASALPAADTLAAGPMLADVTMREATVWVQTTAPALVRLVVQAEPAAGAPLAVAPDTTAAVATAPDGTASLRLSGLAPGTRYTYRVLVDGRAVPQTVATGLTTQPLWQYRTDPPTVTVAIGSCFYDNDEFGRPGTPYGGDTGIFRTIAGLQPDAMVWLGDNVYLRETDWWSAEGIAYRYAHARATPDLQPLLAAAPHYAAWDDHDYGPNDSDRSYIHKGAALDTFRRYWPNPTYGLPGTPGAFTQFQIGDAEFFLLDDRSFRTPNGTPDVAQQQMLGSVQYQWLVEALTASRAPFKVVAMGGQIVNPAPIFETYANVAGQERAALFAALAERRIDGVVFLSGDRHHAELQRLERPGTYPLYDFTSSPLTAGVSDSASRDGSPERDAPTRIAGTLVNTTRNFGTLTFSGTRADRSLTMRTYDPAGAVLWEHTVRAADLTTPR
ncbi:MAG TPA: alkaline phosphatase D family protein [Rubricoccaceae bacterium]|jgi:alkaline phosphatase D